MCPRDMKRKFVSGNVSAAPKLPEVIDQIPPDPDFGSVTVDGTYDTRKCHDAIAARDAHTVMHAEPPMAPENTAAAVPRFGSSRSIKNRTDRFGPSDQSLQVIQKIDAMPQKEPFTLQAQPVGILQR